MKGQSQTVKETSFRYLKDDEVENPHYCIAEFCGSEIGIEMLRHNILSMIKAACTRTNEYQYGNPEDYVLSQRRCIKLLELAYVLKCSGENFALEKNHSHYQAEERWLGFYPEEDSVLKYSTLYFRTLCAKEVNNVKLFLDNLFVFADLKGWHELLDDLLICAHHKASLEDLYNKGHLIIPIINYLEKLVEAVFLVYETKSLEYIRLHHNEQLINYKLL